MANPIAANYREGILGHSGAKVKEVNRPTEG